MSEYATTKIKKRRGVTFIHARYIMSRQQYTTYIRVAWNALDLLMTVCMYDVTSHHEPFYKGFCDYIEDATI